MPASSDTEHVGEVSFGEPSTPRSAVKVTYGGKRKFKQSPSTSRAGTSTSGSPTRPSTLILLGSSPSRPPTNGGGSQGDGHGRGGRSQWNSRARSSSPLSSLENSSMALSDPEIGVVRHEDPPRTKHARRNTISGSDSPDATTKAANSSTSNGKDSRKRPLSPSSSEVDIDSSAPPSSPARKKKHAFPPTTNIAPRLARQFMRAQSQLNPKTTTVIRQQAVAQSKSLDNLFAPLDSTDDESSDETETGSLVWVSIDMKGNLADCKEDDGEDTLWWPAKVLTD